MATFLHRLFCSTLIITMTSFFLSNSVAQAAPKSSSIKNTQKTPHPTNSNTSKQDKINSDAIAEEDVDFINNNTHTVDPDIEKQLGTGLAPTYKPAPENTPETSTEKNTERSALEASASTRINARTMALQLPAPRGQIVDRKGVPLAQNKVAYQLVLKYGQFEKEDKDAIIAYGQRCIRDAEKLTGQVYVIKDEQLWSHYQHRRWLPFPISSTLSDTTIATLKNKLPKGLELLPIYTRIYPQGTSAAHLLGYVGSKGKLPKGPINNMDPLWEIPMGRSGFEDYFDKPLTGKPGVWRLMFDEEGNKILDELSTKPKPGGTVVTTLNIEWQKIAEKILDKKAKRGAFVLIDIHTGEILVLASNPSFDPNKFVPNISQKDYEELRKDPNNPLVSRAFQGVYPPASTFKSVVALSALSNKTIDKNSEINCAASVTIDNHTFNNWHKSPEGNLNVYRGLARSNNVFFIQLALRMGAASFLSTARLLGMGQKTGLPIQDQAGLVPDDDWLRKNKRRKFYAGDAANLSIGQGVLMATPLQIAQFMTAIALGNSLPKLHLIKQIQDIEGNVIYMATNETRTPLTDLTEAAENVREGLYQVVNSAGGTGRRGGISYAELCGKTGTGQWGGAKGNKRVGWFAGFMPYKNPRYAFAALYEGKIEERVGGGSHAAPIVKEFFESVKKEILEEITPPVSTEDPTKKESNIPAEIVADDDDNVTEEPDVESDITIPIPSAVKNELNNTSPSSIPDISVPELPPIIDNANDDSSSNNNKITPIEVIPNTPDNNAIAPLPDDSQYTPVEIIEEEDITLTPQAQEKIPAELPRPKYAQIPPILDAPAQGVEIVEE